MRILYTDELDKKNLSSMDKLYLYNGLDCLICREVFDTIHPMLDETSSVIYDFMRGLQAPVMEMQLRGVYVDKVERRKKIKLLESNLAHIEKVLNFYAEALWGQPLNARSWQQKGMFLYDFCQCTEIKKFDYKKGESKRTTDRSAIEKIHEKYLMIRPITSCILQIMDISKQLGTLRSGMEKNGYFKASFMVAGTETGRLSSKTNVYNRGSNAQNWAEHLRSIFTALPGPIPNREQYNIPEEYKNV